MVAPPNAVLMAHARDVVLLGGRAGGAPRVLDVGCGAGRNAVPLAESGCTVVGTDLSEPMVEAARAKAAASPARDRLSFLVAAMAPLPLPDGAFDSVVAHGVWNLAHTDAQLRAAVAEAARVARRGASLFLFTFSRATLPPDAVPLPGQDYVYTQFNGDPCCFLTEAEVITELGRVGFVQRPGDRLTEYNRPKDGLRVRGPVTMEGVFYLDGAPKRDGSGTV